MYREAGIRPFLELGFMPAKMASGTQTIFYWKGNTTPPKDEGAWTRSIADGELVLQGRHSGEEQQFDFTLCLRPWGEIWPQDSQRPYYYETWYLPLIEAGEPMPDQMDVTDPLAMLPEESEED